MGFFYTVREGDYLSSIARAHGFVDGAALYEHPANEALRNERPDPNILAPGDLIYIPSSKAAEHSFSTDTRLRVEVPTRADTLEVELRTWRDEPYANAPYTLVVAGEVIYGDTDDDGRLRCERLPPGIKRIELEFAERKMTLVIGGLDPVDTVSGIQGRLRNLCYYSGRCHGILDDATRDAITRFKRLHDLGDGPRISDVLIEKLAELHGC